MISYRRKLSKLKWWSDELPHCGSAHRKDFLDSSTLADGLIWHFGHQDQENAGQPQDGY